MAEQTIPNILTWTWKRSSAASCHSRWWRLSSRNVLYCLWSAMSMLYQVTFSVSLH